MKNYTFKQLISWAASGSKTIDENGSVIEDNTSKITEYGTVIIVDENGKEFSITGEIEDRVELTEV